MGSRVIHGCYTSFGRKGEAAKEMPSLRMDIDDVAEVTSRWFRGCRTKATSLNSAEGGTLFFCFLFHSWKAITPQTIRSKTAPVTPIASAVTFNDFPCFVVSGVADFSVEESAVVGGGLNEVNVGD